MFTGLIENLGTITDRKEVISGCELTVECPYEDLTEGESISIDGACLTATRIAPRKFIASVSPETLKLTRASDYKKGSVVNLERALRLGDRLGGHWVTGHVDTVARSRSREPFGEYIRMIFDEIAEPHMRYLLQKGSVAVNGVSLTVNSVVGNSFEVMLIPHTLSHTNLGEILPGETVNLELDWMVKAVLEEVSRNRQLIESSKLCQP